MGKSSKDITIALCSIVDDKTNFVKCAEVDRTPVIGADMRDNFQRRDHLRKGVSNPKSDMAFPPRMIFKLQGY